MSRSRATAGSSQEEVAAIVRICARHRTPVVAYGTGAERIGVFFEYVARPIALVVCGEGADTAPLAALSLLSLRA